MEEPAEARLGRGQRLIEVTREDLELYGVEELEARLEVLEAEINRTRGFIDKKRAGRAAAEQAGKGSGPRRAAAASFAAGAARAAGVSGRSAAGAGARFRCRAGGPLFLGSGRVRQYRNSF